MGELRSGDGTVYLADHLDYISDPVPALYNLPVQEEREVQTPREQA